MEHDDPKQALHQFAKTALDQTDDRVTAIKALLLADRI